MIQTAPPSYPYPHQAGLLETIIAQASGQGRAALAILRISGPESWRVLAGLLKRGQADWPVPRRAGLRQLIDPRSGELLDEAVVLGWREPHSSTGEDVVELTLHGGRAVIEGVVQACLATGLCRIAEPGEFTQRAFSNGRIDLLQAEAIGDLVDAETAGQRRYALAALSGGGSARVAAWRAEIVTLMARLEAAIDFADEGDIPADVAADVGGRLLLLAGDLAKAASDLDRGVMARDGFRVAILGPPNVGKSSLLNALVGRSAAIVSPIAGTTRDVVEVRLVLAGFPVWIADTAGLRETADTIESEGVRRALERAEDADLRLFVESAAEVNALASTGTKVPFPEKRDHDWSIYNKSDQAGATEVVIRAKDEGAFWVSALTGEGVERLVSALSERVAAVLGQASAPLFGRARHRRLVLAAQEALLRAESALTLGVELCAEDLRLAGQKLAGLTGEVDVEDVLGEIFSRFCVGK